jgi:anti-sigma-K factor RskA
VKYRDEQLRDALASEYALGTLQGRARRRFERSLKDDPQLRALVTRWQDRLAPLDAAGQPIQPPARLWRRIQERVQTGRRSRGLWSSLPFWRTIGLAGLAGALALAVLLPALMPRASETMVVVMSDAEANPAMTVSWPMQHRGQPRLRIRVMGHPEMASGTAWELWLLPGGEHKPVSLGLIGTEPMQELAIPRSVVPMMDRAYGLAMSVEPSGGSPTGQPTGPVLYKGQCVPM